MTAPAVVQSGINGGSGGNKPVTLGAAPTDGNMLVGFYYDDAGAAPPATINGWTRSGKTADNRGTVYTRIASGLAALLPTMNNGDTGYTCEIVYEVSNADTVDSSAYANGASVTSLSIGPATTVNDTALGLLFCVGWFAAFGTTPTITAGGWTQDRSIAEGTAITATSGHQSIATHGTSYSGTASFGSTSQAHCAGSVLAVFKNAVAPTPASGMLLQGVGS
jgi:hypothetical protein